MSAEFPERWLSSAEFASVAGISRPAARAALSRARAGLPWRGCNLIVREGNGRGGRAGAHLKVSLSSLSEELQGRLRGQLAPTAELPPILLAETALPLPPALPSESETLEFRLHVISPAIAHPKWSSARGAAVKQACRQYGKPERTVLRWIAAYESKGLAGLRHGLDGRKLGRRIHVSREFDRAFIAAGGSEDELRAVAQFVDLRCKAEWASKPGRAGWRNVAREVETSLRRRLSGVLGREIVLPRAAYQLKRCRVDSPELRNLRWLDRAEHDAKAVDDTKPRVTRTWEDIGPMQMVFVDVKPLDIPVLRPDGTVAYPRLVAFMDGGTQRIFGRVFHHFQNESTRQEHIIQTFIEMVMHPEWGVPLGIYRDNGSEVAAFDRIERHLRLVAGDPNRPIIDARPYQGASKAIEGAFGSRLDRYVISQIAGWAGGDRMRPKTQNVGRKPNAYPGSFDQFCDEFDLRLSDLNNRPMIGARKQWGGLSPVEIFQRKAEAVNWRPIAVDQHQLDAAFCTRRPVSITKGTVRHAGTKWRHPELPARGSAEILIPWRRGARPAFIIAGLGLVYLEPDLAFHPLDLEGARAAGRAQGRDARRLKAERKSLPPSEADENLRFRAAEQKSARPRRPIEADLGASVPRLAPPPARLPSPAGPSEGPEDVREWGRVTERLECGFARSA